MIDYGQRLVVEKIDFIDSSIIDGLAPNESDLAENEVLLKIDKFAYTANNVTYALVGHQIGYWNFFPVPNSDQGIIPCWGFATVQESKNDQILPGTRYYGFYPMASHLKVLAGKISNAGITDIIEHRRSLPIIYNQMTNCATDPIYKEEYEDIQALVRPLFTTSFLIHDQYVQNEFYGADQVVIVSASSKTGLGLASCLKYESAKTIGLTSDKNIAFVQSTGYYDEVISYNDIDQLKRVNTAIVDFAGNHSVELRIQKRLGDLLKMVTMVGMVRYEDSQGKEALPFEPQWFFAPTYAQKRIKELGMAKFGQSLSYKYFGFVEESKDWLKVKYHTFNELQNLHEDMIKGSFDATIGNIITIN